MVGEEGPEPRKTELARRPVVEPADPGHDDPDVEQVAEAVLGADVPLQVVVEGVARREARAPRDRKMPVMPRRGSPSSRPAGDSRPRASRGAATSAWAYSTRTSTRLMKNRSTRSSRRARSSWARNAEAIEVLWARYQVRAVGSRMNASVAATPGVRGSPARPKASAEASQVSLSSVSFTERHHGLPGAGPDSGFSSPRRSCQPRNADAARR